MSLKRHGRRTRDIVAALLLTCLLSACSMWVPTTTPLPMLVAEKHPAKVRLDFQDGTHADIRWPVMVGDSMVGSDSTAVTPVSVREITQVQVREFSLIKTMILSVTIPAVTFAILCTVAGGCDPGGT